MEGGRDGWVRCNGDGVGFESGGYVGVGESKGLLGSCCSCRLRRERRAGWCLVGVVGGLVSVVDRLW